MARSYRELFVWQKARTFAVQVYRETERFPKIETYGLSAQLRRASVSVVSNIAEGQGRLTRGVRTFSGLLGAHCWKSTRNSPSRSISGT